MKKPSIVCSNHSYELLSFNCFLFQFSVYASSADLDVVDDGDGSIFNGDENHKVWSGSQDRLDAIGTESPYDFYSGGASTLSRAPRARQISAPIPVPPPPKEELKKQKLKKAKTVGSQSLSGTLIRPKPVHGSTLIRGPPPPGSMIYGPMNGMAPPQPRQFHTFSHRGYMNGSNGQIITMPMHPHAMQMPVMMPTQYATLQNPRNNKKKKKDKMNGIPLGMPVAPPIFAYPQPPMVPEPRPLGMSNRKLAQSAAALDESGNSGAESPGGTGIYRRKGMMNERAFSYSIRQEHRSRSHGSLASLQFNPPDMKKEREIAQMMAGLDMNEDATLHRRNHNVAVPVNGSYGNQRR